jgi:hypothetical protein
MICAVVGIGFETGSSHLLFFAALFCESASRLT